jgi:hypothetical protein
MSTFPTVVVLSTGEVALVDVLASELRLTPFQARIGESFAFQPTENGSIPSPSLVFTVPQQNIRAAVINQNQVRFAITFTEDEGNFVIGNIILDLVDQDGDIFPFCWWVSDIGISKIQYSTSDVGNRYIISFIVEFFNIADAINMTVTSPLFASIPSYDNELVLPDPNSALFQQQVLQIHSITGTPALAMRRSNDTRYFGFPYLQRLDHPFFGSLEGGFTGDNYKVYTGDVYWGGYFIFPDSMYPTTLQAGSFFTATTIGGGLFTDTSFSGDDIICDPFTDPFIY